MMLLASAAMILMGVMPMVLVKRNVFGMTAVVGVSITRSQSKMQKRVHARIC